MLKVGIIGYGKMGRLRHETCINLKRAEVVAVHDPYSSDLGDTLGATKRENWQEIVHDPELDIVLIATVNALNKDLVIAGLQAGKHVFCEKPPTFNAAEMEQIIDIERRTAGVLMYGFNHRHHGAAVKMREIVESGEFGNVLWMRGRYGKSVDNNYLSSWRAKPELAGGGILLDQGIHMLDLFLFLGGNFDEVQAMVSNLYWKIDGIEDNVFAILRNTLSGQVASLHSTMTQWRHLFSLEVFMDRGYMVLNGLKTASNTYGQERLVVAKNRSKAPAATWKEEEIFMFEIDTSWEREMTSFFDAIEIDRPIRDGSSNDALEVMKLVDQIYRNRRHVASVRYNDLNGVLASD